jgi:POT family proton-dependent oligopeptide transporter
VGGGYLADKLIGTHRSMLIGSVIIAAGHFCLALPGHSMFFLGLGLVILGTGFFKANVSTMVGQLYREDDPRRDGGFTIFYMGVNLGALIGPIVCAQLAKHMGWHWAFGAAGVGMLIGLAMYLTLKSRYLPGIGLPPARNEPREVAAVERPSALTEEERRHVLVLLVLYFFIIFFWTAFEQAGSSMNLFAAERTRLEIGPFSLHPAIFQSVNPAIILMFAPLFARMWDRLGRSGRDPSTPAKMAAALALVGIGFVFMVGGALGSEGGQRVSAGWLLGAYAFHTWGELCLSPIGLALVSRMAPRGRTSLFMGLWFVATALAELCAGHLAAATDKIARGEVFQLLGGQADFYLIFVVSSAIAALALAVLTPKLKRLMA